MDYAQDQKSNWVNFNSLQLFYIQNWNHISKKTEGEDSAKSLDIPVNWKSTYFALSWTAGYT